MKLGDNSLLFSLLFSLNSGEEHEVTWQDLRYFHTPKVNKCQIKLYSLIIEYLSNGMGYDEIYSLIDNIDIEEYNCLDDEAKYYVKTRIKKDVKSRQINEQKCKGVKR